MLGVLRGTFGVFAFSAAIVIYLLSLIYKRLKEMRHILSVILTNVDSSRNLKKCTRILNNLSLALLLFFSAMLFPFILFALNSSQWLNLIPFVLVTASFYYLKKLVVLIDGTQQYAPSYSAGIAAAKF